MQLAQNAVRDLGHVQLLFGAALSGEPGHSLDAGWQNVTELTKDTADHVHHLSTLADNEVACAMDSKHSLQIFRFDLDKSHRGSRDGLADRLCINSIGLPRLTYGLT